MNGKETGYGIGWNVIAGPEGVGEIRHLGDTVGAQAFLVLRPKDDMVIALVCTGNFWNYKGDGTSGSTDRLAAIFSSGIKNKQH